VCTDLIQESVNALRNRLPSGWSVVARNLRTAASKPRPPAVLEIGGPDGSRTELSVLCKAKMLPKDVLTLLTGETAKDTGRSSTRVFVVAAFLSPRTRQLLAQRGAAYADRAGNFRLVLQKPAVFIETAATEKNPEPDRRPLGSLKGPAAGRVVRALADFRPPYGIRELAHRADATPAAVSRVAGLLDREAILARDEQGGIQSVDWIALLRRWTADYSFLRANQVSYYLEPRGLAALKEKLRNCKVSYALTGSVVASEIAPVASPRLAVAFSEEPERLAEKLYLRQSETGSNVMLARPFDTVVFDRTSERDGLRFVSVSQVAADLLTGPGRSPEEAESLIEWMKEHEDAWRA